MTPSDDYIFFKNFKLTRLSVVLARYLDLLFRFLGVSNENWIGKASLFARLDCSRSTFGGRVSLPDSKRRWSVPTIIFLKLVVHRKDVLFPAAERALLTVNPIEFCRIWLENMTFDTRTWMWDFYSEITSNNKLLINNFQRSKILLTRNSCRDSLHNLGLVFWR